MSSPRELSWTSPSMASFLFSLVDFYHVFSKRTFMDFALSGFFSIFPSGFLPCLFKREPRILPSMALHFALPHRIFTMSLQEGTTDFAFNGFIFSLPSGYRVSSERTFKGFIFSGFSFYFKSPTVLSSKGPLLLYCCDA